MMTSAGRYVFSDVAREALKRTFFRTWKGSPYYPITWFTSLIKFAQFTMSLKFTGSIHVITFTQFTQLFHSDQDSLSSDIAKQTLVLSEEIDHPRQLFTLPSCFCFCWNKRCVLCCNPTRCIFSYLVYICLHIIQIILKQQHECNILTTCKQ